MKIAVLGGGRIGGTLGRLWTEAGHEVTVTFSRGRDLPDPAGAVADADAVLLAVPWAVVDDALAAAGPLDGKVLIDATNGGGEAGRSGAESIAARVPGARVVKAINTVFAPIFPEASEHPGRAAMLVCGDDERAKRTVDALVHDLGFEPVDAGSLEAARHLESFAQLVISLAYRQGRGPFAYRFAPPADL